MLLSESIKIYIDHMTAEHKSAATIKGYGGALMQFCLYLRNPLINLVTTDEVDLYFKQRAELGWKRNSMVVPAMALKKFFEYWRRKGYPVLDYEMLPIIHKEGTEPRVASQESLTKVLAQCEGESLYDVRNRAIILMISDTGMRNGELCSMNVVDVTEKCEVAEENGVKQYACVIRTEKARTSRNPHRRVFWYEEAHTALSKWLEKRGEYTHLFPPRHPEALFISTKDSHGKVGSRMTPFTVGLVLRRLSERAGIETVNAHSVRHKFGGDSADNGLNNSNISDLMGHASMTSSFVYTHLRGKSLAAAHRKVKPVISESPP
jgi:site-specific recombinase XerD